MICGHLRGWPVLALGALLGCVSAELDTWSAAPDASISPEPEDLPSTLDQPGSPNTGDDPNRDQISDTAAPDDAAPDFPPSQDAQADTTRDPGAPDTQTPDLPTGGVEEAFCPGPDGRPDLGARVTLTIDQGGNYLCTMLRVDEGNTTGDCSNDPIWHNDLILYRDAEIHAYQSDDESGGYVTETGNPCHVERPLSGTLSPQDRGAFRCYFQRLPPRDGGYPMRSPDKVNGGNRRRADGFFLQIDSPDGCTTPWVSF